MAKKMTTLVVDLKGKKKPSRKTAKKTRKASEKASPPMKKGGKDFILVVIKATSEPETTKSAKPLIREALEQGVNSGSLYKMFSEIPVASRTHVFQIMRADPSQTAIEVARSSPWKSRDAKFVTTYGDSTRIKVQLK